MDVLRVPMINANEDEVLVAEVRVEAGTFVEKGTIILVFESTKATLDYEAPCNGYVRGLQVEEGGRYSVGEVVGFIAETMDEELPDVAPRAATSSDVRATRRARELAKEHGIDLGSLGATGIIREKDVRVAVGSPSSDTPTRPLQKARLRAESKPSDQSIVVFGAGGHARVIVDLIRESYREFQIAGIVDDGDAADVFGYPVVANSGQLKALRESGILKAALGVGAVTNNSLRIELFDKLKDAGFEVPNLVHRHAAVEPSVRMGGGNQIFANATVGSNAELGDNTIINSGVVVSHDCVIGSHTHLTPGAILAGGVKIGENSVIGMGVTIYIGVTIGRDVTISNGVHVMRDVPDGTRLLATQH